MLINNTKESIAAYHEGLTERAAQLQPTWHADVRKNFTKKRFSIMEICS